MPPLPAGPPRGQAGEPPRDAGGDPLSRERGVKLDGTPFNHASEREFAELLSYYGVAWQYEPHTFPLEWDEAGRVTEAFTPDFYLPEQDLYIELTTRQQRLITEKHRKIRKLQTLHPDIRIKLLRRRDYLALARRFGWRSRSA